MNFYLIIWAIELTDVNCALLKMHQIKEDLFYEINERKQSEEDYFGNDRFRSIHERLDNDANIQLLVKKHNNNKGLNGRKNNNEMLASHSPRKRVLNIETNVMNNYDYEYLLDEYYQESLNETKFNTTYRVNNKNVTEPNIIGTIRKLVDMQSKKCSQEDIGLKAIKCLFIDYYNDKLPFCVLVKRLWRLIKLWLLTYIVLAIPLWCTRGLCCCCLCCKFFKPHQTIEEAKKYFIMNPPGLLKTTKGHEVLYEPKKSERDMYEEFEHLIRTI